MGNSLCVNKVRLGSDCAIRVTEEEFEEEEDDGGYNEGWTVSYTTYDDSSCTLYLEKTVNKYDRVHEVFLQLKDDICSGGGGMRIWIERAQSNFLDVSYKRHESMLREDNNTSMMTTKVFYYGRGSKKGLVVLEWKKKSKCDENPYTATVAHYYAVCTKLSKSRRLDIGLSMVVNFRVSNKNLDYKVEGPTQHPCSDLFSMFKQVYESGTWNPMACPHCAHSQMQIHVYMYQVSETESESESESERESESETESEDRNILLFLPHGLDGPRQNARRGFITNESHSTETQRQRSVVSSSKSDVESAQLLHGPTQTPKSVLSNAGMVKGNYNGSLFINPSFIFNSQPKVTQL